MERLRQWQLVAKYGDPTKRKAKSQVRQLRLPLESSITAKMATVHCHESIAAKFVDAYWANCRQFDEWPSEIQSYNVRKIAGTDRWSLHSWALAWDIFDDTSKRIDPGTGRGLMTPEWYNGMQSRGFFAGQNFRRKDLHHVEYPW